MQSYRDLTLTKVKVNSLKNIYVYHLELEFCGMEVIKVLNIQNLS